MADIEPDPREVRAWAAQVGVAMSNRGGISAEVIRAYQRAHGIEPFLPEQRRRLPVLPGYRDLCSLVVRTDFSDDDTWDAIVAAIREPTREGFVACVDTCDDRAFADLPGAQLIEHLPNGTTAQRHRVLFVVDARTVRESEHPLIAIDAREPGREFRLIPSAVQVVGDNMNTGNMGFQDFVDQVDAGGIFRRY